MPLWDTSQFQRRYDVGECTLELIHALIQSSTPPDFSPHGSALQTPQQDLGTRPFLPGSSQVDDRSLFSPLRLWVARPPPKTESHSIERYLTSNFANGADNHGLVVGNTWQRQGLWLSSETPTVTTASDSDREPQARSRSSSSALASMTP